MKKKALSDVLACVVIYGNGFVDFNTIPQVGDFGHWNIKKVIPCQVLNDGAYVDLRTDKEVVPPDNSAIWPLLRGTVITYPDSSKFLLSREISSGNNLMIDITDQPTPTTTTSLFARC